MELDHEGRTVPDGFKTSKWEKAISAPAIFKTCTTCKLELSTSEFRNKAANSDGHLRCNISKGNRV